MTRAPDDAGLLDRSIATLLGYFELGNEVVVTPHARFVRNLECHRIYDANHGRIQSDGRSLEDPDLIRPNWNLVLPSQIVPTAPSSPSPL